VRHFIDSWYSLKLSPSFLVENFNFPNVCCINYMADTEQSQAFLKNPRNNFQMQPVKEPKKEMKILDTAC